MTLIFQRGGPGQKLSLLPPCDVPEIHLTQERAHAPRLPQVTENELMRHYKTLFDQMYGVNSGSYPLGSCTMKYNPKIDEEAAALPGFTQVHPTQDAHTVQGCLAVLHSLEKALCAVTGMDGVTLQPAAGAHGEFAGLLLIKAYHQSRGDGGRNRILIPDSAHGTNPASARMAGFEVVNIPSGPDGCVDLDALRAAAGPDTAGLMLTNPNTVGIFERNILDITRIVHDAGGLCYYDGANLNAVVGVVRPGDMGFDVCHLNLHKTFATPHGGGGPGSGPVGCKAALLDFLPGPQVAEEDGLYRFFTPSRSIGRMKQFYGNFTVAVKALAYLLTLGRERLPEAAENAVLNANYMMSRLAKTYDMAYNGPCMHEFVMTLEGLHKETGVSALDIAKGLLDHGIHPPTMYFPLIVHEALMIEPTETESKADLDAMCAALEALHAAAISEADTLRAAPHTTPIHRLDEVGAARNPILRYEFNGR